MSLDLDNGFPGRKVHLRGFAAILVSGPNHRKNLDPNSITMGNVQNHMYSILELLDSIIMKFWPLDKKICYLESVSTAPLASEQAEADARKGKRGSGLIESMRRFIPSVRHSDIWDSGLHKTYTGKNFMISVIILPAGSGKTTYAQEHDILIDIDDVIDLPENKPAMKKMRGKALENGNWDEVNRKNGYFLIKAIRSGAVRIDGIFLIHNEDQFEGLISMNILGKAKLPKSEMNAIALKRDPINSQWGEATRYNWEHSDVPILTRDRMSRMVEDAVSSHHSNTINAINSQDYEEVKKWWDQPIINNVRWHYGQPGLAPRKLNVQTCRQFSHGLAYVQGITYPQVFPSSHLRQYGIDISSTFKLDIRYMNYDPYIVLEYMKDSDNSNNYIDFAWARHPLGGWTPVPHSQFGTRKDLFVVIDDGYCNGWGSIVVAWHASFGMGATIPHTFKRDEVKERYMKAYPATKIDVSGHIIHAMLAHDAHFTWFVSELVYNYTAQKTIYLAKFVEQRQGRYHSLLDYRAGLDSSTHFPMPPYALPRRKVLYDLLGSLKGLNISGKKAW